MSKLTPRWAAPKSRRLQGGGSPENPHRQLLKTNEVWPARGPAADRGVRPTNCGPAGHRLPHKVLPFLLAVLATPALGQQDHGKWMDYGGGLDSSHYVTLNQITRNNVSQLDVAWTYPTQDRNAYLFNPIIVDNMMYVLARNYSLVALNAGRARRSGFTKD